jgi:glucoamylase
MSAGRAAPGQPGIDPRWTSSAKSGIGTAIGSRSHVWFTLSHGILNEVYYPRVDHANTRDMGFLIADGAEYFSEEKRDTRSVVETLAPGVPGYRLTNTSRDERYRVVKTIVTDPDRDVVLQHVQFHELKRARNGLRLYVILAPHLGNQGAHNAAMVGDYKGVPMLFASRDNHALALACSVPFAARSCGYVGVSDGWQQLDQHKQLTDCYDTAPDGNVAVTGEIDLERSGGRFVLALAFGTSIAEAGQAARASLLRDFTDTCDDYVAGWTAFHDGSRTPAADRLASKEYLLSVAMLRAHEDKAHQGGSIASLSIPWGSTKGDHDIGGYHVVWPRDLVESASALLAAGHDASARFALHYLVVTQDADGHWPQNMWLDGIAWLPGTQLDETALPILLADQLRRLGALGHLRPWPAVRLAAAYIVQHGPVTPEDRWEEDGGYSPFTLAVEVAALLAAADFADVENEPAIAAYLRDTADVWNASIERWTYVEDTDMDRANGVAGHYVRIAPKTEGSSSARANLVLITNRGRDAACVPYGDVVSPDALALVRFGLRSATDSRIVNTVRIIDAKLRTETRNGPTWHRYTEDGYGEHADGSAFDGTGIGRGWPLLVGERGHYELARGNVDEARRLLDAMCRQTSLGGLIPEQIWDAEDVPARELVNGCPSGSAMPLAWAHAEFVKLARSIQDGCVFDLPPQTVQRYVRAKTPSRFVPWRFNNKIRTMPAGKTLRIETRAAASIHWSADAWRTATDTTANGTGLGIWVADLPTESLPPDTQVVFTMHWPDHDTSEGRDYTVKIVAP